MSKLYILFLLLPTLAWSQQKLANATMPAVTITGDTTFCANAAAYLLASGADTYLWSNGGTTALIAVNVAGTYSVTGTDGVGNTSSASVVVNNLPIPVVVISGDTTFCPGGSTVITASGGVNYLWTNSETTAAIIVDVPGIYDITVTGANGCTGSAYSNVYEDIAPVAVASNTGPYCWGHGEALRLQASGGLNYHWSGPLGYTSNIQIPMPFQITPFYEGIYTVTVTDAHGCSASDTTTVVVIHNLPSIMNISPLEDTLCYGDSTTITIAVTNATAICGMRWLDSPDGANFTIIPGATDTFFNTGPLYSTTAYLAEYTCGDRCYPYPIVFLVAVFPDTLPPLLTCPATQYLAQMDSVVLLDYSGLAGITDNCHLGSITQNPPAGTVYHSDQSVNIELTATDQAGNFSTCSFICDVHVMPQFFPGHIAQLGLLEWHLSLERGGFQDGLKMTVYPNPADEQFVLKMNHPVTGTVEMTDLQGHLIQNILFENNEEITIQVSGYPDGCYFVRLRTEEGVRVEKLWVR